MWHRVAAVDEIPSGESRFFSIDERPVVVANWRGEFSALYGICPHREYRLDGAVVCDSLIECPWHSFQFDVRTGANVYPRNAYSADVVELKEPVQSLPVYRIELRGSEIWVALE